MFETVETIHKALHIESTWVFVMVVALAFATVGAGAGWLVDQSYKNSAEYRESHSPPPPATQKPSPSGTLAIDMTEAKGNTIEDLEIHGFDKGIDMTKAQSNHLSDVTITGSQWTDKPLTEHYKVGMLEELKNIAGNPKTVEQILDGYIEFINGRHLSEEEKRPDRKIVKGWKRRLLPYASDKQKFASLVDKEEIRITHRNN
jgi:hypothetical protein